MIIEVAVDGCNNSGLVIGTGTFEGMRILNFRTPSQEQVETRNPLLQNT